jgi:regulatory protein
MKPRMIIHPVSWFGALNVALQRRFPDRHQHVILPGMNEPQSRRRPLPTAEDLHAAALAHLSRYAATETGLRRVLARRILRWARAALAAGEDRDAVAGAAAKAREAAHSVVARLVDAGAVNDTAFAVARGKKLLRRGRSRQVAMAHLIAKGVDAGLARTALPENPDAELAAALVLARRRRIGPFRTAPADAAALRRERGILARAGFPERVAACALGMDAATAEALVRALRRT